MRYDLLRYRRAVTHSSSFLLFHPAAAPYPSARMSPSFPATRWSVVAAAGSRPAEAHAAWSELYGIYWYPLYAYARRTGLSPENAEDATQSFWLRALAPGFLAAADPARGRLRTFLLTAFSRDLMDEKRNAARQKRGGGIEFIPLDTAGAEERYLAAPASSGSEPGRQFDAEWAAALLAAALTRVEAAYTASQRAPIFKALSPFLSSTGDLPNQASLATQLGMSHTALRQSLTRLRDHFRKALRATIADTLDAPTDPAIDEELLTLRAILAG